jgi:hypothetical protein
MHAPPELVGRAQVAGNIWELMDGGEVRWRMRASTEHIRRVVRAAAGEGAHRGSRCGRWWMNCSGDTTTMVGATTSARGYRRGTKGKGQGGAEHRLVPKLCQDGLARLRPPTPIEAHAAAQGPYRRRQPDPGGGRRCRRPADAAPPGSPRGRARRAFRFSPWGARHQQRASAAPGAPLELAAESTPT